MTYFDLSKSDRILYEAIHGGPAPKPGMVRSKLAADGVAFPCRIFAIDLSGKGPRTLFLTKLKHNGPWHVWQGHPGMAYISTQASARSVEKALQRQRLSSGPPIDCEKPERWIRSTQQAIISLRARQLEPVRKKLGTVTFQDECEARAEALRRYREKGKPYRGAVTGWMEILLLRRYRQLNEVRRKLIEFLILYMRDWDACWGAERPLYDAIGTLRETFPLPAYPTMFLGILEELAPLLRGRRERAEDAGEIRSAAVRAAMATMRERFKESIGLREVAQAVHVSAAHLSREFRKETGLTLTEFLQQLRIVHARELLAGSDLGVLQVALESGFSSPEHFHRTFKKKVGLTPRTFRLAQQA